MRGTEALDDIFVALLDRVKQRMSMTPMSDLLKKHILGIFLSAVLYNRQKAYMYLEQQQMIVPLLTELMGLKAKFKHTYERKMFIIGISDFLQNETLPQELRPILLQLITSIITT